MDKKWFIVINPVSGGKKGPKLWNKIKPLLDDAGIGYDFTFTEYIDHASAITAAAIQNEARNFCIIGGDGTANDVINGVMQSEIDGREITVAMLPAGTGNDWVRTLGKYRDVHSVAQSLNRHETFLHDVGEIWFEREGRQQKRYFINIAGFGFEGHVAKRLYEGSGFLQGTKLHYQLAILRSLFLYHHTSMTITVDGVKHAHKTLSIACGICRYNGGGLKQLPEAAFDDGLLDMTLIGSMSKLKMAASLPKLKGGTHVLMKEVVTFKGKEFHLESEPPVYIDADGEYLGTTPSTIKIQEKAIRVLRW